MKVIPSLDEAKKIKEQGKYTIIPVSLTLLADQITPIEALKIIKKRTSHCYILESVMEKEKRGRYTFLGYDPLYEVTLQDHTMKIGNHTMVIDDPSQELKKLLEPYRCPIFSDLPSFTGGFVGYFSFEYFGYLEPSIRQNEKDPHHFKDLDLMLFDKLIVFDHFSKTMILIHHISLDHLESEYVKALEDLKELAKLLFSSHPLIEYPGHLKEDFVPLFSKEEFTDQVKKAKKHIHEGDIFQIVLSNVFSASYEGSLFNTYRMLRSINPSPYMFYFSGTDVEVAGASPETLVKLENGMVYTFPLAGTRPRGKTQEEDEKLEQELLSDEKELAEHNMLVDLGRNDLGKICTFNSVRLEKLHTIERYSHVMHIASCIGGKLKEEKDAFDVIEAVLPAGTLSGAPKIKACQLIHELENYKRGIYGGAVGYIDFHGNMDMSIAIRMAYQKNGKVFVRSGAGIVADSNPEKEYEECLHKAKAVFHAIQEASQL